MSGQPVPRSETPYLVALEPMGSSHPFAIYHGPTGVLYAEFRGFDAAQWEKAELNRAFWAGQP